MERPAPVRKSHTNTADLLAWPEGAQPELADGATPPPNRRPHQVTSRDGGGCLSPASPPALEGAEPFANCWVRGSIVSSRNSFSPFLRVQPSEAIHKVVFGGQVTEEEAESLNKR